MHPKATPSEIQVFHFYSFLLAQNVNTNIPIFPSDQKLFKGKKYTLFCLLHMPFILNTSWEPHLCSILPQKSPNTTLPLLPYALEEEVPFSHQG